MTDVKLPRIIGHRGAAENAPENTLESFRAAAAEGAQWVEFDAKLTADNAVIILHDDDLDRTTTGKGPAKLKTLAELQSLDAGAWFKPGTAPGFAGARIPTLKDTVALLDELGLSANVELKPCPGRERETASVIMDVLRRIWPRAKPLPLISSFVPECLRVAQAEAPEFPRGLLLDEHPLDWLAQARGVGAVSVNIGDQVATPDWCREIKAAGYGLLVYTVNDAARAAQLFAWGVDGVFTDAPGRLLAKLVI
jgi:glycerophosphoryl diester phosphodiesterase